MKFTWEAPAYGKRNSDTLAIEKSLADLDYEPSCDVNEDVVEVTLGGFTQKVNDTLTYGLVAGMKKTEGSTLIAYTVVSDTDRESILTKAITLILTAPYSVFGIR